MRESASSSKQWQVYTDTAGESLSLSVCVSVCVCTVRVSVVFHLYHFFTDNNDFLMGFFVVGQRNTIFNVHVHNNVHNY